MVETEGHWYFSDKEVKTNFSDVKEADVINWIKSESMQNGINIIESRLEEQLASLQNEQKVKANHGRITKSVNNFKNTNLKTVAGAELAQTAKNILRGQNTQSTVFVPTAASVADGIAKSVQSIPGLVGNARKGIPNINTQSNGVPSPNSSIAQNLGIDL
jgi:hypothetical protein